jgi:CHAT domain-containing protein
VKDELAAAQMPRMIAPRLSVGAAFRPCPVLARPGRIPSLLCPGSAGEQPDARLRTLEQRIESKADSGDIAALQADALLDLVWRHQKRTKLWAVIDVLRRLSHGDYHRADTLADLAAAYLVRAGEGQRPIDLLYAAESAANALEIDPRHRAARYDLALALEELTCYDEAAAAWRSYTEVDPTGGWADEARRHAAALVWKRVLRPAAGASDTVLARFAREHPQEARETGWDEYLAEWGTLLPADTAGARTALHRALVVGRALEANGRDASLADAVRAIESHGRDSAATRRLADAHRMFGAARVRYVDVDYARADSLFEATLHTGAPSPVLMEWAQVFHGPTHFSTPGGGTVGLRVARVAVAGIDHRRYPALAGRAYSHLGSLLGRSGDPERGLEALSMGARLLERAGEGEYAGAALGNLAEGEAAGSAKDAYYSRWYAAATMLGNSRDSQTRHRELALLSRHLVEDGFSRTALRVNDELGAVGRSSRVRLLMVESLDIRAEGLARSGDLKGAIAEVATAETLLSGISDTNARRYFTATLSATRGVAEVNTNPATAEARLDSAIANPTLASVPLRLITLLLARADARVLLGRIDSAVADVRRAMKVNDKVHAPESSLAAASESDVGATVQRVAAGLLAKRRSEDALQLLELASVRRGHTADAALPASYPPERVIVRYELMGDTLRAWTLSRAGSFITSTPVSRAAFRDTLNATLRGLEQRDDTIPGLRRLYEWLIRPIRGRLGETGSELVIVPGEGPVAATPFAALQSRPGARYLLQDYVIWRATSVAAAAADSIALRRRPVVAGIVEDPAIDHQLYPDLPQLRGASEEVPNAREWKRAFTLSDSAATRASLSALLLKPEVSLLHFAGHAVSDPFQADSSFLVLALNRPSKDDLGRLTASDIARMKFDGMDLVVLSACSTLWGSEGGSGGFTGLGGAFLNAGARGVIGSLWHVEDRRTRDLMTRFYTRYRTQPDAARALRDAQLEMLNSVDDPRLRSSSAWAGFEYVGR